MKKIKLGIVGAGRGVFLARDFLMLGCEIVALYDTHEKRLENGARALGGVPTYTDFEEFLSQEMDAVVLANYFHEHAPLAIKCFERNMNVFSECTACGTLAEGVALLRAHEKSKSLYMLAENYPFMRACREITRVTKGGTLGKILYAEGEYNHPGNPCDTSFKQEYIYFEAHWRNFLPRSYYITHSLAPLMHATGAIPRRVTAFNAFAPIEGDVPTASYDGDAAAIVTTQNDDGSIFRVTGCAGFGAHHNSYRVCGTKGQIENLRGMGGQVMRRYNGWQIPEGEKEIRLYYPEEKDPDAALLAKSSHDGGDFIVAREFIRHLREGSTPEAPFDLLSAVTMSAVAILAHRSMLEGGVPYDVPDFTKEEERVKYEEDTASPFKTDGERLPCCSHADFRPTDEQLRLYRELASGFYK